MQKLKLIHYFTKFYVFHKRKFSKATSETQVSFVNEAPGPQMIGISLMASATSKMSVVSRIHVSSWCNVWTNFNHRAKVNDQMQADINVLVLH